MYILMKMIKNLFLRSNKYFARHSRFKYSSNHIENNIKNSAILYKTNAHLRFLCTSWRALFALSSL